MTVPAPSESWMQKNVISSPEDLIIRITSRAARLANPLDVSKAQSCRSGQPAFWRAGKNPSFSQYRILWKPQGRGANCVHFVLEVLSAEARFVSDQLAVVVRAAGPRVERVTRTTTRPDGAVTVEVTEREVFDWRAAMWLLTCKDPDTFGSDRRELGELRKELGQLRRLVADGLPCPTQWRSSATAPARSAQDAGGLAGLTKAAVLVNRKDKHGKRLS